MHPDCSCNEPTCFGTADVGHSEECGECPFWDACEAIDDRRIEEKKTEFSESIPCFGGAEFDTKVICDVCEAWGLCSHEFRKNKQKEKVKDMSHQVQKTFSVCTAHRLMDHPGACKNLHGHNYNITVYLEAGGLNDQGMVIDFSAIKETVGKMINELYDHKTVLQDTDPLVDVLSPYMFASLQTMPCAPTAENMAKQVLHKAQSVIAFGVRVVRVDVEETKNSIAIYVE